MSTNAEFQDLDEFKNTLEECRSDNFGTNWVLVRHVDENPGSVMVAGHGSGGPDELKDALEENGVMYALVRFEEQIDQSNTVKFVYVHWIGKEVPFTKKGRFGVVHGSIRKHFEPYHVSVETDNAADLDREALMSKVEESSGSKSNVLNTDEAAERRSFDRGMAVAPRGPRPKVEGRGFGGMKGSNNKERVLKIDDAVFDAAADVRSDSTDTNWFAAGYENGDPKCPVVVLGSGNDGISGIQSQLKDDIAGYALFRVTDIVDDIATVKFAYIQWIGENLKPLSRAKISTHKSDLDEIFHPAHGTIFATSADEIEEKIIMDKIMSSSGSKSHVRNMDG